MVLVLCQIELMVEDVFTEADSLLFIGMMRSLNNINKVTMHNHRGHGRTIIEWVARSEWQSEFLIPKEL